MTKNSNLSLSKLFIIFLIHLRVKKYLSKCLEAFLSIFLSMCDENTQYNAVWLINEVGRLMERVKFKSSRTRNLPKTPFALFGSPIRAFPQNAKIFSYSLTERGTSMVPLHHQVRFAREIEKGNVTRRVTISLD